MYTLKNMRRCRTPLYPPLYCSYFQRYQVAEAVRAEVERGTQLLEDAQMSPNKWEKLITSANFGRHDGSPRNGMEVLARDGMTLAAIAEKAIPELATLDPNIVTRIQIEALYGSLPVFVSAWQPSCCHPR